MINNNELCKLCMCNTCENVNNCYEDCTYTCVQITDCEDYIYDIMEDNNDKIN